jgi:Fic family protein
LFSYPYIKIKVLEENNIAKRQTAASYLKILVSHGILQPIQIWKETYYINEILIEILSK